MDAAYRKQLIQSMGPKIVEARMAHIFNTYGSRVLVTSSFGTTSAILLHIISRLRASHPIYFIDTGYHFPETLEYKETLTRRLGLNVIDIHPDATRHEETRQKEFWTSEPDRCCRINKVEPLRAVQQRHVIWVSGLMAWQNAHRSRFELLEDRGNLFKFYPLLDWSRRQAANYYAQLGLPRHPLEARGYESIGCSHCTQPGRGRDGRWAGSGKTECGLHINRSRGES